MSLTEVGPASANLNSIDAILSLFSQSTVTRDAYLSLAPFLDSAHLIPLRALIVSQLSEAGHRTSNLPALRLIKAAYHLSPLFAADLVLDSNLDAALKDVLEVYLELDELKINSGGDDAQQLCLEVLTELASVNRTRKLVQPFSSLLIVLYRHAQDRAKIQMILLLIKLKLGWKDEDGVEGGAPDRSALDEVKFGGILEDLRGFTERSHGDVSTTKQVLEALTYLLLDLDIRKRIMADNLQAFRQSLLKSILQPLSSPLPETSTDVDRELAAQELSYGLASFIFHLTLYERESEDSETQERFVRLIQLSRRKSDAPTPKEPYAITHQRISLLLEKNPEILSCISKLCRVAASRQIRRLLGKIFLNLTECQSNKLRGRLVQGGAVRCLLSLVSQIELSRDRKVEKGDFTTVQALSRLFISFHPLHIVKLDQLPSVISPFCQLVAQEDASLLQKFEGLMALTNISSLSETEDGEAIKERIASYPSTESDNGFPKQVHALMIDDHALVRRSATELTCNLVCCEQGFVYWGGVIGSLPTLLQQEEINLVSEEPLCPSAAAPSPSLVSITSRVHLLLSLSASDDSATRSAASGALATLANSDVVSYCLLHRVRKGKGGLDYLDELLKDEDMGVRWRAVEIIRAIAAQGKEQVDALKNIVVTGLTDLTIGDVDDPLRTFAMEVLGLFDV
ncbi:hypothetical protein BT69DRAFT_1289542 [Atractiella rhizophila]|nr:hypothetical protein BT69DRAFT_1289542 [Atractiella rhizophila]